MQLTLRDYFWLTIVIGLAIGIVIEHYDVRRLRQFEGKAQWWEKAARHMGQKAGEKNGLVPYFEEFRYCGFKQHEDDTVLQQLELVKGRATEDREQSMVTGHQDLDFVLLLFLLAPIGLLIGLAVRNPNREQAKAYAKNAIRRLRWWSPITILMFSAGCLVSYASRRPFSGAMGFTAVAFFAWHYRRYVYRGLTPELEKEIDENIDKQLSVVDLFKLGR